MCIFSLPSHRQKKHFVEHPKAHLINTKLFIAFQYHFLSFQYRELFFMHFVQLKLLIFICKKRLHTNFFCAKPPSKTTLAPLYFRILALNFHFFVLPLLTQPLNLEYNFCITSPSFLFTFIIYLTPNTFGRA